MSVLPISKIKFPWFVRNVVSNPLYLSIIVMSIPIAGLVLEKYLFTTSFCRSGALLVCIAIFCIYINHFLSVESENVKSLLRHIKTMGETPETIMQNMNPAITGEFRKATAAEVCRVLLSAKEELPKLIDARERLVKVEFLTGLFGTLIWAFGDLIKFCI